jgi:hypothetical protein
MEFLFIIIMLFVLSSPSMSKTLWPWSAGGRVDKYSAEAALSKPPP